jgi:hypothetical protein
VAVIDTSFLRFRDSLAGPSYSLLAHQLAKGTRMIRDAGIEAE